MILHKISFTSWASYNILWAIFSTLVSTFFVTVEKFTLFVVCTLFDQRVCLVSRTLYSFPLTILNLFHAFVR